MKSKIWKVLKITIYVLVLALIISLIRVALLQPSNDKVWEENSKILPHFTIATSTITIDNLRDWRYKKGEVISKKYYSDTFELDKIQKMYLVINPFSQFSGIAHSFLVFEFDDGKTVSVSVESRREEGEKYTVLQGVLNKYELWYAYGSVGDLLGARIFYSDEDLRAFPLIVDKELVKGVFVDLAKTAQGLETSPKFYNTVTSNCTNVLAESANRVKKGSVPWNIARVLTGYADNHLYKLGYIKNDESFDKVYEKARVDIFMRGEFKNRENYTNEEFWNFLKERI
jgi:hypothetical protein